LGSGITIEICINNAKANTPKRLIKWASKWAFIALFMQ
jgi:hypothetical protein